MAKIIINPVDSSIKLKILGTWDPTDIPDLRFWYDFDNPTNVINTDTIDTFAEVKDRSINNNHMTQSTKADQPTVTVVDGLKFEETDGISKYLYPTDPSALKNDDKGYLIAVINNTTIYNSPLTCTDTADNNNMLNFTSRTDTAVYNYSSQIFFRNKDSGWDDRDLIYGNTDLRNEKLVIVWGSDSTQFFLRTNGVAESLDILVGTNSGRWMADASVTNFAIGILNDDVPNYNGSFVGDLLYYSDISEADLILVENYLMNKHNIT